MIKMKKKKNTRTEMIVLVILFVILNRSHSHIVKCEILFIFKKNFSDKNSKSDKRI